MMSGRRRAHRGMTLLEMMIAVGLFFLCMGMTFTIFYDGFKDVHQGKQRLKIQNDTRTALDIMLTELREGVTIHTEATLLQGSGTNSIEFTKMDPFKGLLRIRYDVSNKKVRRTEISTNVEAFIGENVASPNDLNFRYADAGQSAVIITLKETDPHNRVKLPFTLLTEAKLRALNPTATVDNGRRVIIPLISF